MNADWIGGTRRGGIEGFPITIAEDLLLSTFGGDFRVDGEIDFRP